MSSLQDGQRAHCHRSRAAVGYFGLVFEGRLAGIEHRYYSPTQLRFFTLPIPERRLELCSSTLARVYQRDILLRVYEVARAIAVSARGLRRTIGRTRERVELLRQATSSRSRGGGEVGGLVWHSSSGKRRRGEVTVHGRMSGLWQ